MKNIDRATIAIVKGLALLLVTAALSYEAFAAVVYVAPPPAGSDNSGDGSAGKPYATVQKGINQANNGDTVHMKAGTYNLKSYSPTLNKTITLEGDGAANTKLTNGGQFTFNKPFTIRALHFDSWNAGIVIHINASMNNILIENSKFTDLSRAAIFIKETGVDVNKIDIVNNEIRNISGGGSVYGIQLQSKAWLQNVNISGNVIEDLISSGGSAMAIRIGRAALNHGPGVISGNHINNIQVSKSANALEVHGIIVFGHDFEITCNTVKNLTYREDAEAIYTKARYTKIMNNYVENGGGCGGRYCGGDICAKGEGIDAHDDVISGNVVVGSQGGWGIYVTTDNTAIENNYIRKLDKSGMGIFLGGRGRTSEQFRYTVENNKVEVGFKATHKDLTKDTKVVDNTFVVRDGVMTGGSNNKSLGWSNNNECLGASCSSIGNPPAAGVAECGHGPRSGTFLSPPRGLQLIPLPQGTQ